MTWLRNWWQRIAVIVIVVVTLVVGAGLIYYGYTGWTFGLRTHDRAVIITAVLTFDALLFAAAAATLALLAYLAASGTPDLEVEIAFGNSYTNKPVFNAGPQHALFRGDSLGTSKAEMASVVLKNKSKYSARYAGVRVQLVGIGGYGGVAGWSVITTLNQLGPTEIQWDSGGDTIVHGDWSVKLPDLDLRGVGILPRMTPMLLVTMVADGAVPKRQEILIRVLDEAAYTDYARNRAIDLGGAPV